MIVLYIGLLVLKKSQKKEIVAEFRPYFLLLGLFILFFFGLGNYWDRLLYNIVLVVQFIVILLLSKYLTISDKFRFIPYVAFVIMSIKFLVVIAQYGPYS